MNAAVFSSQKCADERPEGLDDKGKTFVQIQPSTTKVSRSVIALMKHFNWTRFTPVVDNTEVWLDTLKVLATLAENNNIIMSEKKVVKYLDESDVQQLADIVRETYQETRSTYRDRLMVLHNVGFVCCFLLITSCFDFQCSISG